MANGGIIYLGSGTFNESNITISKDVSIIGDSTKSTVINANKHQLFTTNANVFFKAFTIQKARTTSNGAGKYNKGTLKIEGLKIQTSYARNLGGAIYNDGISMSSG